MHRSRWQRLSIEFCVLGLGGLAYWQLLETGSLTQTDPVLLLGPSLLLLALGFVFARFLPPLLRWAAWAAGAVRGLILPLGLNRLARHPSGFGRVLLLTSLTAGLIVFATVFRDSITAIQRQRA